MQNPAEKFALLDQQRPDRLPWQRYCVPRGEKWPSENGFLVDPESEHAEYYGKKPIALAELRTKPVLILLGEAGIGKSDTLLREFEQTKQSHPPECTLFRDLREYGQGSDSRLINDIFESEPFAACSRSERTLFLFLDSLDECRMDMKHLSAFLSGELKKRSRVVPHLFLRIACRGAMWPPELEETLTTLWPSDQVGVFDLCPLRKHDAALKARSMNLDDQAFLEEVVHREVETLASRPKTLGYLLREFSQHGQLPPRKIELFERACFHLCEEDTRRADAGRGGKLTTEQRLRIASRIAAAIIFGNRTGLWLGGGLEQEGSDPTLDELTGEERDKGTAFQVTRDALRETLTISGLFSQRDPQRAHFGHQSDAEFLAAYYVSRSGVDVARSLMLLRHAGDGKIVPQLYDTAAWLASFDQQVFSAIAETEPEVLLSGDFAAADVAAKKVVVKKLLEREETQLHSARVSTKPLYKLAHLELHDQLLPYITSTALNPMTRALAIEIAVACSVSSLQREILAVALIQDELQGLRVSAINAIQEIGDSDSKQSLLPLAKGEGGDDPNDRLKGAALSALWPIHLSSAELFALLDSRHDSNNIGTFYMFVRRKLPQTLQPEHLPDALQWAETQPASNEIAFAFRETLPDIMRLAWQHLDTPNVLPAFARTAQVLLRRHEPLFFRRDGKDRDDFLADAPKRRLLLSAVIPLFDAQDRLYIAWGLARSDDVEWLLQLYQAVPNQQQRETIAQLLNGAIRQEPTAASVSAVIEACINGVQQPNEPLRRIFEWLLQSCDFDADWVKSAREHWRQLQKWREESRPRALDPSPKDRVKNTLRLIESGTINAWITLADELTLDETSQGDDIPHKLFDQPGWQSANEATRARILQAAFGYLRHGRPPPDILVEKQHRRISDLSGGSAIELLAVASPDLLDALTSEDFAKWSPVLVGYSFDHELEQQLFRLAYGRAPQAFHLAVLQHVTNRGRANPDILHLAQFDCVWSEALGQTLFGLLHDSSYPPKAHDKILEFLLGHQFQPAREFAVALLDSQNASADKRETAAVLLLQHDAAERPKLLSRVIHGNIEFARAVFMKLATPRTHHGEHSFFDLDDESMADSYIWLEQHFTEDPEHGNGIAYTKLACDHIARFQSSLLEQLTQRGTTESCCAIERITRAFPDEAWLQWRLDGARRAARRETWVAPSVGQIFSLCADRNARLIRSEQELIDAVLESLGRLQQQLCSDETPLAPFLWNESNSSNKQSKPKNENRLSDFVKLHLANDLKRRGVLVNREVEVHNWPGQGRGNCVDILVQAITSNGEKLSVVVESKGCWNPGLDTQMETQLRQQYLVGVQHRCGIYLVGWFGADYCQGKHRSIKTLERKLETQAKGLSHDGITLRAFVLDGELRLSGKPSQGARRRQK